MTARPCWLWGSSRPGCRWQPRQLCRLCNALLLPRTRSPCPRPALVLCAGMIASNGVNGASATAERPASGIQGDFRLSLFQAGGSLLDRLRPACCRWLLQAAAPNAADRHCDMPVWHACLGRDFPLTLVVLLKRALQDGLLPAAFMVGLLVSSPIFAEASKHHNAFRLIGLGLAVSMSLCLQAACKD